MNPEEQSGSLADQAASWVPPWQRPVVPPATDDVAPDDDGAIDESLAELIGDRTAEDEMPATGVPVEDEAFVLAEVPVEDEAFVLAGVPVEDEAFVLAEVPVEDEAFVLAGVPVEDEAFVLAGVPVEDEAFVLAGVPVEDEAFVLAGVPVEDEAFALAEVPVAAVPAEDAVSAEVEGPVAVAEDGLDGESVEGDGDGREFFVADSVLSDVAVADSVLSDVAVADSVLSDVAMAQAADAEETDEGPDEPFELKGALEAILLVVDEPVSEETLAQVLNVPVAMVAAQLAATSTEYTAAGRGFDLRRIAGGWRLYTRGEFAAYVERFVLDGQSVRLTQAALETLAVIAYQQPVTRSRISAIRGVNCDGTVRTLVTRGLIEECGTQPESGAFLYRTTSVFLEKLGLDSVDELPPLAPFLPDDVNGFADAQR